MTDRENKESATLGSELVLSDFPSLTSDKIRFGDTDRQGHVNNAVFVTLFETGLVEILVDPVTPLAEPGSAFVMARLVIDYRREINWPGIIFIGTRVASIGRSSITLEQALFQDDQCVATAQTVVVQMDKATRRSRALPANAIARLSALLGPETPQRP